MTETKTKERPILFSGEMVRAILDGRKTQTRRVVKPQPDLTRANTYQPATGRTWTAEDASWLCDDGLWSVGIPGWSQGFWRCPYGAPGDQLWVRETWASPSKYNDVKPSDLPQAMKHLPGGKPQIFLKAGRSYPDTNVRWRPSIHMPRWASRIQLEVTGVRVERIQEIGDEDIQAEGITGTVEATPVRGQPVFRYQNGDDLNYSRPVDAFRELWDSINADRGYGWDENPWVWVIEFRRIEPC